MQLGIVDSSPPERMRHLRTMSAFASLFPITWFAGSRQLLEAGFRETG